MKGRLSLSGAVRPICTRLMLFASRRSLGVTKPLPLYFKTVDVPIRALLGLFSSFLGILTAEVLFPQFHCLKRDLYCGSLFETKSLHDSNSGFLREDTLR